VTVNADERYEVTQIATRYSMEEEVRLIDGTRADLLSESYAIEVDWSVKWAESIGQSLYYGVMTNRSPGIILIRKNDQTLESHDVYVGRCQRVCERHHILLWEAVEGNSDITQVYPLVEPVNPFKVGQ